MTVENKVIIILLVLILTFYSYYIKDETPKTKEDGQTLGVVDKDERTLWGSLNMKLMEDEENTSPVCFPLQAVTLGYAGLQPRYAQFIPSKQMTVSELKSAVISKPGPYIVNSSEPIEMNFNEYRNKIPIWDRHEYVKADVNAVFINGLKEDKLFPFIRKKDCDLLNRKYFLGLTGAYGEATDSNKELAKKVQESSWNGRPGMEFENYINYLQTLGIGPLPSNKTPKRGIFSEK